MGQQQLLLIVLGVIIVGIAIAVGISMFKSNAMNSNRDQVINDLNNLGASAQQYYRRPTSMAGGQQSFANFTIDTLQSNSANGFYQLASAAPSGPSARPAAPASYASDSAASVSQTLYITGWGTEVGKDGSHPVEAYVQVTNSGITSTVVN
jgi:Tfp pilus assembly protein PilE